MSTIYMSQLSTLPLMEGDQDQGLFPAFHIAKDPPILFPFMIDNPAVDQHQVRNYGDQHLRQQVLAESNQQFNDHLMIGGSDVFSSSSQFRPTIQSIGSDMIQRSAFDPYDIGKKYTDGSTSSWAVVPPAKMKIMRKATTVNPEGRAVRKPRRRAQAHTDESQQQHAVGVVRMCSDCNTTKTPLWRSGPRGPKSLCNACGIRQRKARRAMAAAATAVAGSVSTSNGGAAGSASASQTKPTKKEKRADIDRSLPFKKRCKMVVVDDHAATTAAKTATTTPAAAAPMVMKDQDHVNGDDNVAMATITSPQRKSTSTPAMLHAFPADEITDAAMLLMTLSCGLVSS